MKRPLRILPLLIVATVVGCQESGPKVSKPGAFTNVKGTVTYNSKPLDKGEISFAVEGQPSSVMDVLDGKFAGVAQVGSNHIAISAKRKDPTRAPPKLSADAQAQIKHMNEKNKEQTRGQNDFDPSMVEYIPPEWNKASKQMRVVEAGGANDFQFDIKGK